MQSQHKNKGIYSLLFPMILSICLCVACLIGGTFAWFSATQTSSIQDIQTAVYTASAVIDGESLLAITADEAKPAFNTLTAGTHEIVINTAGTANSGFCVLRFGDEDAYTDVHTLEIKPGSIATIKVTVTGGDAKMQLIPKWGKSAEGSTVIATGEYTYTVK